MDTNEYNLIFQHRIPGSSRPVAVIRRFAYTATDDPEYIGFALSGSAESDAAWYIEKLSYVDGNYAGSTFSPKLVTWTDRASHTYS